MTAKSTKGDEVEDVQEPGSEQAVPKARKKPVRRVRVIEVLEDDDDLDLDEVLATAGLADDEEEEPPRSTKADAADTGDAGEDDEEEAPPVRKRKAVTAEADDDEDRPVRKRKKTATVDDEDEPPVRRRKAVRAPSLAAIRSNGLVIGVTAVLAAALATFAIYEWREEASLQSAKSDRAKVAARVTQFGNVVMSYDLSNISGSASQIRPYLTGDALTDFQNTLTQLQQNAAKTTVSAAFKSKTDSVYVKDVNGRLASAVLIWTLSVSQSGNTQPLQSNLGLTIDLIKDKGTWKIAKYTGISQLNLTGSTASASPSPTK